MFAHNIVVRHANGEYEGFSGCGFTAEAAERSAKARAIREIEAKRLDPARVSYLTKQEFDGLDDGTKAMIRKDWRPESTQPVREYFHDVGVDALGGEFKGVPGDWGTRSAYSRISRIAAPGAKSRYEWGGELLTKAQMLSRAVAKEVVFMGNDDVPTFHAVMDEPEDELHGDERSDMKAGVFPITQAEFHRLRTEDATTPQARERYLALRIKELSGKLSMRDAVDFNSWARRSNPNPEEKVAYLQRVLFGLAGIPAKFTPPDMSRPAP